MLGGIIGAAAGTLGGIFGGISKNNALKKQMKLLKEQKQENQDWFNRKYNEDATQRADAQAVLTRTAEMLKQRNAAAAGTQAVMGGTGESLAVQKEANAKALADATSQIVAAGEARKDQIESQYLQRKAEIDNALTSAVGQKTDGFGMVSNALGGGVDGFAKGMGLADKEK